MGILDTLFGRQKPVPAGPERLFAMSTAQITLQADQSLTPTGSAAMLFKGVASGPFAQMQRDLDQLLRIADRQDEGMSYRPYEDALGYRWLIFEGADFQSLVTSVHVASRTFLDQGYGSQLLLAIFAFKDDRGHEIYWMYNYKAGAFYPFVPQVDSHDASRRRDNAEELRLSTALGKELPMDPQLERWYPVWDIPF
jgi:hypothetical protein